MSKTTINWLCDSSENWSIHKNEAGLTAEQSFLGRVTSRKIGYTIMYIKMGLCVDDKTVFMSLYEAKNKLMEAVDGELLDIWA